MKQLNTQCYIFISHAVCLCDRQKDWVLVAGSVLDLVPDVLNSEADKSPNKSLLTLFMSVSAETSGSSSDWTAVQLMAFR